ncbi:MAG: SDR family oxidoreductase [Verrucomicrobia bacterium]|nr:SDR family oxidoreductase [Verrucomicrobiota bacterium]
MELKGKVAIVTGGGTGIGRAVALELARAGCRVCIAGRREEVLRQTASEASPPLAWQACDVADCSQAEALVEKVCAELGAPAILVNSAGVNTARRALADMDPEDFERLMRINAAGSFYCIRAVVPHMKEMGGGLIVNIVSIAGKRALPMAGLAYCASKFAQSALGTFVNLETNPHGIRVTNIYPGEVDTPILDRRPQPPPPERRAQMLRPEDIAACALAVARLPERAVVPELVIVPRYQSWS